MTVSEELKRKLWLIPRAGSAGQELFVIGLQALHVCEKAEATNAESRRMDLDCMMLDRNECGGKTKE